MSYLLRHDLLLLMDHLQTNLTSPLGSWPHSGLWTVLFMQQPSERKQKRDDACWRGMAQVCAHVWKYQRFYRNTINNPALPLLVYGRGGGSGGGGYIWAKEEKEFWLKQGQRGSTINLKRKKKQCNCYFSVPLTLQVGVILVSKPRQWVEGCMCVCVLGGLHQSLEEDTSVHKERKMSTVRVGEKEEIGRTEEEGRWGWWAWRVNLLACVITQMCTVFVSCVCVDWGGAQQWTAVFIRAQTLSHFKSGACLSLKSMYLWCLWQQVSGGGRLWMMVSRIPSHNNGDHGLPTMWCHFWAADEREWCIEKEGWGMLVRENENKII